MSYRETSIFWCLYIQRARGYKLIDNTKLRRKYMLKIDRNIDTINKLLYEDKNMQQDAWELLIKYLLNLWNHITNPLIINLHFMNKINNRIERS